MQRIHHVCVALALLLWSPQASSQAVNRSLLRIHEQTQQEKQRRLTAMSQAVTAAKRGVAHVYVKFKNPAKKPKWQKGGEPYSEFLKVERGTSGIILTDKGLVVTNYHLVKEALTKTGQASDEYWIQVELGDNRSFAARLVSKNERLDLALLQLELGPGETVPFLTLVDSSKALAGEPVVALGHPDGEAWFSFTGCLSRAGGPVELRGKKLSREEVLLTDAVMLPQVDGGALVDCFGQVLGINNTSHFLPQKQEPTAKDLAQPDYSVVLSATTIRKAFRKELSAIKLGRSKNFDALLATRSEEFKVARWIPKLQDSVVSVWSGDKNARPKESAAQDPLGKKSVRKLGSGVVVDASGLVLTNAHFLGASRSKVYVTLRNGETFEAEVVKKIARWNQNSALLKVDLPSGTRLPAITLGSSSAGIIGERILMIGNPYGNIAMVGTGFLSTLDRGGQLQVSGRVRAGLSGGALVNMAGQLIGIVNKPPFDGNMLREDPIRESGIGFATPIDKVREWYRKTFDAMGSDPSLAVAPKATQGQLEERQSAVSYVARKTWNSLLNVYVEVEIKTEPKGFDPFASEEKVFRGAGMGSGVIIDKTGLAITNWHVVDSAVRWNGEQRADRGVRVSLPNGKKYRVKVLSTSRDDDLALIQLELAKGETVEPVKLGDSDELREGEAVVAIGNPFGQANTVTVGVVSAKERALGIKGRVRLYRGLLQTDAGINPGNSGGALLDLNGYLVGINSAGSGWTGGNGFAIPVNRVRRVIRNKLMSSERLRSSFVGIVPGDVGDMVVASSVHTFGPAARAGLKNKDRLLQVGSHKLHSSVDFVRAIMAALPGKPLTMQIEREGQILSRQVIPISNAVWKIFRQTGMELSTVDYRQESELVGKASVALHRAYTGDDQGQPSEFMTGALRIDRVHPAEKAKGRDLAAGDLLLGVSMRYEDLDSDRTELVRFQNMEIASKSFNELAEYKGMTWTCWVYRDGSVRQVPVRVRKVR